MNATGFPVQFPMTPSLPQARMAQAWTPARRQQPMAVRMSRPVSSTLGAHKLGQSTAQLWARGSDISFSILTGVAAIVSGLALVINFGKGEAGLPARPQPSAIPGQPMTMVPGRQSSQSKPVWYVVGGVIAFLGAANIWSSINRASSLQIQTAQTAPPANQTVSTK